MSFTRCYYDKDRINICQDRDLDICKYVLNVPGNGNRPSFINDPQIRLQKFGANISSNIGSITAPVPGTVLVIY